MIKAYAKINLVLRVLNKRSDGYHDLQMYNSLVSLHDDIYIKKSKIDSITYSIKELNTLNDDFIKNMVAYIKATYNIKDSFNIYIKKRIPVGGGLGGASSDAASILSYLNKKYHFAKDITELSTIGLKFSSDIPFFLYNSSAFVYKQGEVVVPISSVLKEKVYLINNNINISTKESFNLIDTYDKEIEESSIINSLLQYNFYNKLEESTFKINDSLKELKDKLSTLGSVIMTGSGSTFVLFTKEKQSIISSQLKGYHFFKVKIR